MRYCLSVSASLYSHDLNVSFVKYVQITKKHKVVGCGVQASCVWTGRCFSKEVKLL